MTSTTADAKELFLAARAGALAEAYPDVTALELANLFDESGRSPLHYAAAFDSFCRLSGLSQQLLAKVRGPRGVTPLHVAAAKGKLEGLPPLDPLFLIATKDDDGHSVLDVASPSNLARLPGLTPEMLAKDFGTRSTSALFRGMTSGRLRIFFLQHAGRFERCPFLADAIRAYAGKYYGPDKPVKSRKAKQILDALSEGGYPLPAECLIWVL